MKQKIQSITEAFSMQPVTLYVNQKVGTCTPITNEVIEIKKEEVNIMIGGELKSHDVYRGYDPDGNIIFTYLANSVNVHYAYKEE